MSGKHRMHTLDECKDRWGLCPIIPVDKFCSVELTEQSYVGYHADAYGNWTGKTEVGWTPLGTPVVKRVVAWSPIGAGFEPHWRLAAVAKYETD